MGKGRGDDSDDEDMDEGTQTYCGRRWNAKWLCCRGRAAWSFKAIFCEANQLMELVPGLEFNDFELFTMSERLVLFCFDLSFVWIAVVLGHMKGIREAGEPPESDGSGGLIYPESACKVNDGIGQQMTSLFDKSGKDHSAIVFIPGFARDGMDFPGGYIFLDILMCLLMNFAVGKTPMEHIMIDALPELPKFDPFYWTNSVSVFGCCLGTYPWVLATTCFDNCCAKDDNCLGNGATSTRNACFVYCFGFIGVAVLMFFYVLGEATGCVLSYILELVFLMILAWTILQPFEASFLALLGFGVDTQASQHEDGGAGAASRFHNKVENPMDDEAPQSQSMDIVE